MSLQNVKFSADSISVDSLSSDEAIVDHTPMPVTLTNGVSDSFSSNSSNGQNGQTNGYNKTQQKKSVLI